MNLILVDSSNVVSIGYDELSSVLEVHFHNESACQYSGVPQSVFTDFLNAPSKGQFLHYNIKGRYSYRRIF
jgi:hypothetical protein